MDGLTDEEIAEITKSVFQEPTVEGRLARAENTILSLLFMA